MGRPLLKLHYLDSHTITAILEFCRETKTPLRGLIPRLPYEVDQQALYAAIRGDAVTQQTKAALETLPTVLQSELPSHSIAPVTSH